MGTGTVEGAIEVDETFFRESFKDDHKKSTTFKMPRKTHKRGLKVILAVKTKREKEAYPRNKFV
jgi:hypothetical protein